MNFSTSKYLLRSVFFRATTLCACAVVLMSAGSSESLPIVNLQAPDLSDVHILGYKAGLRPSRKGGVRLAAERVSDKLIIHDYGHGGAGITISWGCAESAVQLFEQAITTDKTLRSVGEVAILGAGVIGLSTAHLLRDKGFAVTVYADAFSPETTSDIAGGIWGPSGLPVANDPGALEQYYDWQRVSFKRFMALASDQAPVLRGVSVIDAFNINDTKSGIGDVAPDIISEETLVTVVLHNGKQHAGVKYANIMIDGGLYMKDLFELAKAKGIQFVKRRISTAQELQGFSEHIIFNCLGLGAREVFGDDNVYATRGQLIEFKQQPGINYYITEKIPGRKDYVALYPWHNKFMIGNIAEPGEEVREITSEAITQILQNARAFFGVPDAVA